MSQLNFTRKTFLEREEISRFQEFLRDDIGQNALIGNTSEYGIIQTDFTGNDTNFQVATGTASGTIQISKERSQALDIDGNIIRLLARDNISVTNDGNWYWVRINHEFRRHELGTVSINTNGQMTGLNTTFTEVLRGQATDVPVRIRFQETDGTTPTNNGTYEVVNVIDDTNAVLTSVTGFTAEANLQYIVIGSTPIGELVSTEQMAGIYMYDSCNVELIQETVLEVPPALPANGTDRYFYIARVQNNAGVVTIQDRRTDFWTFNTPGLDGKLTATENLSDVTNVVTSRNNLDVYSRSEVDGNLNSAITTVNARIDQRALANNVLRRNETDTYTPTQDTHPANKLYVDTEVNTQLTTIVLHKGSYLVGDIDPEGQENFIDQRVISFGTTLSTANYVVMGSYFFNKTTGFLAGDNDALVFYVLEKSTTQMILGFRETVGENQSTDLRFDYILIAL